MQKGKKYIEKKKLILKIVKTVENDIIINVFLIYLLKKLHKLL